MSSIKLSPNASGTGIFTIAAPNSNTDRTLTLPDQTGTVLTNAGPFTANASASAGAVTIDASNNVGIGTSSPTNNLQVEGKASAYAVALVKSNGGAGNGYGASFQLTNTNGDNYQIRIADSGSGSTYQQALDFLTISAPSGKGLRFSTNGAESARIDSSGNLLVGTTSFSGGSTIGFQINATNNTSNAYAQLIKNSSGTEIFQMRCNGGLANYSANNVNLSDARVKTDIQDAGGYLAKICAIPVRTFKYKDQTDDLLNLGCIAQEVEAAAPELVDATGFGETPEDGVPLKAIYQTDLQYALMKCIQEQQALIESLTARIAALEAQP